MLLLGLGLLYLFESFLAALESYGVVGVEQEDLGIKAGLLLGVLGGQGLGHQLGFLFLSYFADDLTGGLGDGAELVGAGDVGGEGGREFGFGESLGGEAENQGKRQKAKGKGQK